MVITKREDVTNQGFCNKQGFGYSGELTQFGGGGWEWESGWGGGRHFIEFELDRKGGGVEWALIRGWALINFFCL